MTTGAMGYMVAMDENGDAEGNYTVIARQKRDDSGYGLYPIGMFLMPSNSSDIPVHLFFRVTHVLKSHSTLSRV